LTGVKEGNSMRGGKEDDNDDVEDKMMNQEELKMIFSWKGN
jgi:hypothetical protein